ncbi:MAG: hypothetical protein ACRDL6_06995 [Solirubrobacterales bacterium]
MEQANRNPALERLDALVGEWKMAAGPPGGDPWPGEAKMSFEWLEGRTWLIQRWSVEMPEAPDGIVDHRARGRPRERGGKGIGRGLPSALLRLPRRPPRL